VDERIQEVMMEEDLLQQIILAEEKTEERDDFLLELVQAEMDDLEHVLEELFKKRGDSGVAKDTDRKVYSQSVEGDLFVSFSLGKFSASLKGGKREDIFVGKFLELFEKGASLDQRSQEMLKRFFRRRFSSEAKSGIRVKDMILWKVMEEFISGFNYVDYDRNLEIMVETASYILRSIIDNPAIDVETLKKELPVREQVVDKVLDYLEEANIFKLFSLLGVIPPKYYLEGELLEHTSMMEVYYQLSDIYYSDKGRVEAIAPGWEKRIDQGEKLSREEEIRLGRQLERGNRTVENVFGRAFEKTVSSLAFRAKRSVQSRFTGVVIEPTDLESAARELFIKSVRNYAANRMYLKVPLSDYLRRNLSPKVYTAAYHLAKEQMDEQLTLDQSLSEDTRSATRKDFVSVSADQDRTLETIDMYVTLESLLIQTGFSEIEIEIIFVNLKDEAEAEDIALELGYELSFIEEVLGRFRAFMESMGAGKVSAIFAGEELKGSDDLIVFKRLVGLLIKLGKANGNEEIGIRSQIAKVFESLRSLGVLEDRCVSVLQSMHVEPEIIEQVIGIIYGDKSIGSLNVENLLAKELLIESAA